MSPHLKKLYSIYHTTGGLFVVLLLITASLFYVLYGTRNQESPELDIRVAGSVKESNLLTRTAGGKVKIVIIGEGLSNDALNNRAQEFISAVNNVEPYGNINDLFEFVVNTDISTSGCGNNIVGCYYSAVNTGRQAMQATGAQGTVILVAGGGTSASGTGLPGPAIINVNNSFSWNAKHEFLGHMVGELNDRYYNASAGGAGGIALKPSNCSTNPNGESWWKTADPASVPTRGCETADTYAPYPNNCGDGKGNSNSIMSGMCNTSAQFDNVERYWITTNIIPKLKNGGGGDSPPGATNPAGFSAMPVICSNGTWHVHFFWDMTKLGLPAGAAPEKIFVDMKTGEGDWGTNNFYSNGPLPATATNLDWGGIGANENNLWRVNALYQGRWYGYQHVASLKTPACPEGANGMTTSFISCANDSWKMNFYWNNPHVPNGQPRENYVDLKHDDGQPFWNPDGSSNFVSNGPLPGTATTVVWDGIKGNQKHRWHVNTSYADGAGQTQWTGYENEATFTTGVCPQAGGTWTGGGVGLSGRPNPTGGGGGGNYTLSATLDKQSYNAGETMKLCYKMSPENIPYQVRIKYSQSGSGNDYQVIKEANDDGAGGGDCILIEIDQNAATGPRKFLVEAVINGQNKQAEVSTTVNAVTPTATPKPTVVTPTPTPIVVTPQITGQTNPTSTPIPTGATNPTATSIPVTTVPGATATPIPNQPTATPGVTGTQTSIPLAVVLPGIGIDVQAGENKNPVNETKNGQLQLINPATNQVVSNIDATFRFYSNNATFQAATSTIPAGTYTAKVKTDNSLWKNAGSLQIVAGQNPQPKIVTLITGDIDQDNSLGLIDYNTFLSCYSGINCTQKQTVDLNLDDKIDEKDINIFYSGLVNRNGD